MMKYTAKRLPNNPEKWAVFEGKQYFIGTLCNSEFEAKERACELSARWYFTQVGLCEKEWLALREKAGIDISEDIHAWGDVLA